MEVFHLCMAVVVSFVVALCVCVCMCVGRWVWRIYLYGGNRERCLSIELLLRNAIIIFPFLMLSKLLESRNGR